jgi:RepB DNA-primase from phage plasmid
MAAKIITPKPYLRQSLLASAVRRVWSRHSHGFGFLAARRDRQWVERGLRINDGDGIEEFFARYWYRNFDLYYCPNAFMRKRRLGMFALPTPFAHVDIDLGDPTAFRPPPTILVETSPGRFQGIWEFSEMAEPKVAEAVSRHLTRTYGGDPGGWSITKFLRVPGSLNHKDEYDLPVVTVIHDTGAPITIWPKGTEAPVSARAGGLCSSADRAPADYDAALKSFRSAMRQNEPRASRKMWLNYHVCQTNDQHARDGVDRSHTLTQIIRRLRELGLTEGETWALAWRSGFNKFRVDGRRDGEDDLWKQIFKAYGK